MSQDTNIFGGRNKHALYTPLSEDEQEVLERLATAGQYKIVVKDWGYIDKPKVRFGDARLEFTWKLRFAKPEPPGVALHYLDLELWTHSGIFLLGNRLPTQINGQPMIAARGLEYDLAWDIQLKQIDPEIVKAIKPGATGLTSRLGNMRLTQAQKQQLHNLRTGEAKVRQMDAAAVAAAARKASERR